MLYQYIMFFRKTIIVPGVIVRYDEHKEKTGDTQIMYAPVVSFSFQGQTREITSEYSSSSPSKNIGEICKVGINPNTQEARIYSVGNTWLFSLAFIFGGIISFVVFLFFFPELTKILPRISPKIIVAVFNIFKCFLIIVLLAPGGVGGYLLYSRTMFFKKAIIVPGTIVRYDKHVEYDSNHKKTIMYTGVISYSFEGTTKEIKSNWSSSNEGPIGETVQVGINPQNPYDVHIYSKGEFWLAIGLICFSSLCLIFIFLKMLG